MARCIGPGGEPRHALDRALDALRALFRAHDVVFVARDRWDGRLYRRTAAATSGTAHERDLDASDELTYFFPAPADVWFQAEAHRSDRIPATYLDPRGTVRRTSVAVAARFVTEHGRSALVLAANGEDRAAYRLFLFAPRGGARDLRTLRAIGRQLGAALYSTELLARMQSRIGAAERARLARDLHDGVIQAIAGLEMQVDVWRRTAATDEEATRLERVQHALQQQMIAVRELMGQLRRQPVPSGQLLEQIAGDVERFRLESGIDAHFSSDVDALRVPPRTGDELVQIVREALMNVRRHSGARHVLVRVSAPPGRWTLEIDDDGRGFGFAGRYAQAALDRARKGPVVIKERVRAIGGELVIESDPGAGSRVEIWLPRPTHG